MARKKQESNVLDMNANMQGTVVFSEPVNLRINGSFSGQLNTKGVLFVGKNAEVNAEIHGEEITIAGTIKGNIIADKRLALLETAVVEGEIFTKKLEIKEGAIFEGISHMLSNTDTAFMTIMEVAKYLEIEEDKIKEWANIGKIPAKKDGENWMFEKNSIDSWLKTHA